VALSSWYEAVSLENLRREKALVSDLGNFRVEDNGVVLYDSTFFISYLPGFHGFHPARFSCCSASIAKLKS
jgi:hypothetical protein